MKGLREGAGRTQEELATIAGLSGHAVSALERGERRRPHIDTVRALLGALDLSGEDRDLLLSSARAPAQTAVDELSRVSLPVPLTALVGRDAEVNELHDWLEQRVARLITLTGPGGVGKTRLALETARVMAARDSARVIFVPLAAISNPALAASAIAEAFGFSDITISDLPARVRNACQEHSTLLVLDNFEHLLDAAPLVAELLMSVASLQVLVTSRAPLRLRGEREYVGPLALDEGSTRCRSPITLLPPCAVRGTRARRAADFRLSASNGATVTAICRRLDALRSPGLAAPWIKTLTAEGCSAASNRMCCSPRSRRAICPSGTNNERHRGVGYQLLEARRAAYVPPFRRAAGSLSVDAAAEVLSGREAALGTDRRSPRAPA